METGFSQWHILLFLSPQIHCLGMNIIVNINCTWSSNEFCNFERRSCLMSAVWLVSISNNSVGMGALLALFWVLNRYINLKALAPPGVLPCCCLCCPFIPHVLLSFLACHTLKETIVLSSQQFYFAFYSTLNGNCAYLDCPSS